MLVLVECSRAKAPDPPVHHASEGATIVHPRLRRGERLFVGTASVSSLIT